MEQLTEEKENDYKEKYFLSIGLLTLGYFDNRPYKEVMDFIEYLKDLAGKICYTSSIGLANDNWLPEKEFHKAMYTERYKLDIKDL